MHVRLSLVTADPSKIDDVVSYVANDARSIVEEKPGNLGMSMAVNELGVAVVETFWISREAMRESERQASATRVEAARRGSGTVAGEHYAVASVVQVDKPAVGAGMRFTRADVDPATVDDAIAAYEDSAVPWLIETPGFCAARLYMDRRTGKSITVGLWVDRPALVNSRAVAATIRTDTVAATGASIRGVEEYRLVFTSGGFRPTAAIQAAASANLSA
jgi:heme-degrading monooxygenase HmoA